MCGLFFFLGFRLEAPFGQKRSRYFSGIFQCGVANLSGNFLTNLLWAQFGNQAVDLLAHLLWLEVTNFFGRIDSNIYSFVVANRLPRNKFTIIWGTGFKWDSLTCCVRELFVDSLGHCSALIDRLVVAHSFLSISFLDILTNFLIHFVTLFDILHHWSVFVFCDTCCFVLGLTDLIGNLQQNKLY